MISLAAYHSGCATLPGMCEHLLVVTRLASQLGLNRAEPTTLVVDLNCAFASIEQQHDPALRGKVLAIAAYATDAATIVSSSREARDLGIKTGMKVFEAKALFPAVIVREPNPPRYRDVSDKLIEVLHRHSPDVLRMSIDEASLDLAGTPDLKRLGPEGVARAIKRAIREEVGECVTASVGVSTSIWMAKQASNLNKRDGLERIDHTNLVAVFERLQLTDLSGIAEASARRLAKAGIHTPVQFLRATRDPRLTVGTLGVGLSALSDDAAGQLDLFLEPVQPRVQRLEAAMDTIRDRFGEDALQRSRLLGRARVVRDRIAFGNTGHPDDSKEGE